MAKTEKREGSSVRRILKDPMELMFREHGYLVVNCREYKRLKENGDDTNKMVVTNFPFQHVYGHTSRTDYLLINKKLKRRIRIECSWQNASGGAESKFPLMYLNCIFGYDELETIFVVDGEGSHLRARKWLRNTAKKRWLVEEENPKYIQVMNLEEFKNYFRKTLA